MTIPIKHGPRRRLSFQIDVALLKRAEALQIDLHALMRIKIQEAVERMERDLVPEPKDPWRPDQPEPPRVNSQKLEQAGKMVLGLMG